MKKHKKNWSLRDVVNLPKTEVESYFSEDFILKDLDITPRVFNGWQDTGLFPDKKGKPFKFNIVEYFWLCIIKDLRAFGFPRDKIAGIKEKIFDDLTIKDLVKFHDKQKIVEYLFNEKLEEGYSMDDLESFNPDTYINQIADVKLPRLLFESFCFLDNQPFMKLIIDQYGNIVFYDEAIFSKEGQNALDETPLIILPLIKYIDGFIGKPALTRFLEKIDILSENEVQIATLIYEGKAKAITFHYDNDEVIEADVNNHQYIAKLFFNVGYHQITVKTEKSEITYNYNEEGQI